MNRLKDVIHFWFGEDADDAQLIKVNRRRWFMKDPDFDQEIALRFKDLLLEYGDKTLLQLSQYPLQDQFGMVILLDQFSRNIYRDQPQAFAFDPLALELVISGLTKGFDQQLRPVERCFYYLPLEHSENLEHQKRSVQLYHSLVEEIPSDWLDLFMGFYEYAVRHLEIIERFGRFPHRNRILGRESTAEEEAFLLQPNSSF